MVSITISNDDVNEEIKEVRELLSGDSRNIYNDVAELQQQMATVNSEIAAINNNMATLNNNINALSNNVNESINSIKDDTAFLETTVGVLMNKVNSFEEALDNMDGKLLVEGQDLDSLGVGSYIIPTVAIANSLLNKPAALSYTGYIKVIPGGAHGQRIMYYIICDKGSATYYERTFYSNAWGEWRKITLVDSGWINLTLENDVQPYSEGQPPQYRKINNTVFIRGAVTNINANATTIATLPSGFRPLAMSYPYVQNTTIRTGNFAMFSRMIVGTNGQIRLEAITDGASFGEKWFPINCSFPID